MAGPVAKPGGSFSRGLCSDLTQPPWSALRLQARGCVLGTQIRGVQLRVRQWVKPHGPVALGVHPHACGQCEPECPHACACVCQRGCGQAGGTEGAWAAASARVAGRASACNSPPSPTLDPSHQVSSPGREKVGAQFPRAPSGGGDICSSSGALCPGLTPPVSLPCRFSAARTKMVSVPPVLPLNEDLALSVLTPQGKGPGVGSGPP